VGFCQFFLGGVLVNIRACQTLFSLTLGLGFLVPTALAGPVLERIKNTGTISLGIREASVPFSYVTEPGKPPVGYSIDLCQKIVDAVRKRVGAKKLTVKYVTVTAATRIDTVLSTQVDLNCESTTNTAERRNSVAFSIPHYITGSRTLVLAGHTAKDLRDFEGQTLVSTDNSAPLKEAQQYIKDRNLKITVLVAPDHPKAIEMVESGEADGFVMGEVLLVAQIANHPHPEKFSIVGKYLSTDAFSIMMSKDDPELKQLVDTELRRLIQNKEADAMHDRWFLQAIPPKGQVLNLSMPFMLKDSWKYPTDWIPN
jgi:ABC-type amino acid transport substrate-binding protein